MKAKKYKPARRHEAVDPRPQTLPVRFQAPPTLADQIARYMSVHNRYLAEQGEETPEEADDLDLPDEDHFESPHELVYDELLNREIPRFEKVLLDRGRAKFDEHLSQKIREDKAARAAALAAEKRIRDGALKKAKKSESASADESQDD